MICSEWLMATENNCLIVYEMTFTFKQQNTFDFQYVSLKKKHLKNIINKTYLPIKPEQKFNEKSSLFI